MVGDWLALVRVQGCVVVDQAPVELGQHGGARHPPELGHERGRLACEALANVAILLWERAHDGGRVAARGTLALRPD
jgi:hypothetical protein